MRIERRSQTALGRKRRQEFDRSLRRLRDLGMPEWAVEYYRRAARVAGLAPHMVVCHVAVVAAGRQLQAAVDEQQTFRSETDGETAPAPAAPSYESVRAMRERVTTLWREIKRHGRVLETTAHAADARAAAPEEASATMLATKLTLLQARAVSARAAGPPRRRKTSVKGH